MPRASGKKRLLNPNKSQLMFVEAPVNGPKHGCGPPLRSAIHPRTFTSEKQQRSTRRRAPWVSSEFSTHDTKAVGRGKTKNQKTTRCKSNTATALSLHHNRRTAVCKYMSLSFETNTTVLQQKTKTNIQQLEVRRARAETVLASKELLGPPRCSASLQKVVKRSTARPLASRQTEIVSTTPLYENERRTSEGFVHTPKEGQTPDTSVPLDVDTPELPCCSSAPSSSVLHLLFPPNQTPPRTRNASILVEDTPEKDYGLRVTWRRRKGLMKALMERGKLPTTDAQIANEWR